MRSILFILFVFIQIHLFSQSEIWGVKTHGGAKEGGFLFSIDSVSGKANIQHRFGFSNFLSSNIYTISPKLHSKTNDWLGIVDQWLIKYNTQGDQLDYRFLNKRSFGEFYEISDSLWLTLYDGGIYKINPYDLSFDTVSGVLPSSKQSLTELAEYKNEYLYWSQDDGYNNGIICRYDIKKDSIERVCVFNNVNEFFISPIGSLSMYNGKFYGLASKRKYQNNGYSIFSYDPESGMYIEELFVENDDAFSSRYSGFILYKDLLYAIGRVIEGDDNSYIFSYKPESREIDILTLVESSVFGNLNFVIKKFSDDRLYVSNAYSNINPNGGIFYYDFSSNELSAIYHFPSSDCYITNRFKGFSCYNDDLYFFDQHCDSLHSFTMRRFNIESEQEDTIVNLSRITSVSEGSNPSRIISTPDGKIIGNTIMGGSFKNTYKGSGVLYQFNPNNKDYEVLHTFVDMESSLIHSDLYLLEDNRILGIAESINSNVNSAKYIFNIENKDYTRLSDFPWYKSIESMEMYSDSNLLMIVSKRGYKPYLLVDYNVFTDIYDTLIMHPNDEIVSNLKHYRDNIFLYQKIVKDNNDVDSSLIVSYNLETNEVEGFLDLNQYSFYEQGKERFYFHVLDDHRLAGTFMNNSQRDGSAILNYWNYCMAYYNPQLDSMHICTDSNFYYTQSDRQLYRFYSMINGNDNPDLFYAYNEAGKVWDDGEINEVDFSNNESLKTQALEEDWTDGGTIWSNKNLMPENFIKIPLKNKWKTWTGNKSNQWYEKENWLDEMVPDTNDNVLIPLALLNHPIIDTLVKCHQLNVLEDAVLEIQVNGDMTVKDEVLNYGSIKLYANDSLKASFIHHKDFTINNSFAYDYVSDTSLFDILSSPIQSTGFRLSEDAHIFSFEEEVMNWRLIDQYPFYPQQARSYFFNQEQNKLSFKGELSVDDYTLNIPQQEKERMYPISNPYTASIQWDDISGGIENKAMYRYCLQDSTYVPLIDNIGWGSDLLQPMDVVWVYSGGNESTQIQSEDRIHASQYEMIFEEPDNELMLSVSGINTKDQTIISFNPFASSDFDGAYDAVKYSDGYNNAPIIFTKATNKKLIINQHPDTSAMDLFVASNNRGVYSISIDKNNGFDFVLLEDLIWNKRINLLEEDYEFEYFPSDGQYPFKLYFKEWVLEPLEETDFLIYYYPESIYIKSKKQIEEAQIYVYDLAGKLVWEFEAKEFSFFKKQIDLVGGNYILQVKSGDIVKNKMIWVRE